MANRYDYEKGALDEAALDPSPILQLQQWLQEAEDAKVTEPTAMCLTTVDGEHRPSSRMVLLRGIDESGLTFFTNYGSRKADQIIANQNVCVCFWWGALERQVRVEGIVREVSAQESDAYFASRPRASQIASAASPQSQVVASRAELDGLVTQFERDHPNDVPRPATWGGYRIEPTFFEFWQGRPARLHDRVAYVEGPNWRRERLAP